MLQKLDAVEQTDPRYQRHWYTDSHHDLIVWLTAEGEIIEFQLCYDRQHDERVLIWRATGGFSHLRVDDGEWQAHRFKSTPIFLPDGLCDNETLAARFLKVGTEIDPNVARFVHDKIQAFDG